MIVQPAPQPAVVAEMFRVRHHYRYVYTGAVFDLKQRLIMIPPNCHRDQELISFEMDVRGPTGQVSVDWQSDLFGNRVCRVEAERVDHALDFEAEFSVRRVDGGPLVSDEPTSEQLGAYLGFTALTAPDDRVKAAARAIRSQATTHTESVELAHDWAAQSITYRV